MANAIISHLGVPNAGTFTTTEERDAMFYKVFSGEVLTAFEETNVFKPLHMVRVIDHGKSCEFPRTWKATARYHTPGEAILGSNNIAINPIVIKVDDLLISDVFLYDLEDAKNHFDVRGIFSKQLGDSLARTFDQKVARVIIKAARAAGNVEGAPGGTVIRNANAATDGDTLASMMFKAAECFDEKDVPESERYFVVSPEQWYLLAQTTKVLNRDWGGVGSYADGNVIKVAGISIIKSNNLPKENITASVSGEVNDYTGNFTDTVGVAFHKTCAATVQLIGLQTEWSGKDVHLMYQGDVCVAKMSLGHGYLRPEAAVEISSSATTVSEDEAEDIVLSDTTILVESISAPATLTVKAGSTATISPVYVAPDNATNAAVTYTSGTTGVATVNSNGVVTGVSAGTSVITIASADAGSATTTCTVTVTAA